MDPAPAPRVAILGAGAGGLAMGIQLKRRGIHSFTIYEKSDGVGGTWRDNTYPGAACDAPSHFYSYSFAQWNDWGRVFSRQPQILEYFEWCADRFGLRPHLRCNTAITDARFDDATSTWHLTTEHGEEVEADLVVSGLGQLNVPNVPEFPGRATFAGAQFHSARWEHDHDLAGERVAVIGNAASAVQFVPRIAESVAHLAVFQRSPNWVMPKPDFEYPPRVKHLFRRFGFVRRLHRFQIYLVLESRWWQFRTGSRMAAKAEQRCKDFLAKQVVDPGLRAALTPDYPIGCKRILIENGYYPALTRDNAELVTSPIARFTGDGIETADGAHRAFDTVIYATGFRSTDFLAGLEVTGRDGLKLCDVWRDGAEAYLGLAVSGFPNFFLLYGPNTNLGHNSIIYMIEQQVHYVLRCIAELRRRGAATVDVDRAAMDAYNRDIARWMHHMVWEGGCSNWYKNEAGRVTNNWPRTAIEYWWRTHRSSLSALHFAGKAAAR